MADRYVTSIYLPSDNPHPATIRLVRFKICEMKFTRNCGHIEMYTCSDINRLKEIISAYLHVGLPLNNFYLEVYDEKQGQWCVIDETYPDATISELKLRPNSVISVEYRDRQVSKDRRLQNSTSVSNSNRELELKLCLEPMNRTKSRSLYIHSSSTVGKLRKQMYAQFNKFPKDQPIFVWNKDTWVKFDFSMDDNVLADQLIESHAFISIDYDENNFSSKLPTGLCGLANLGSTCFMNSVFQCLSNIPEFNKRILAFNDDYNAPIIGEYIKLMKLMWSGKYNDIDPSELLNNIKDNLPRYESYRQQDAQEFMNHFLHLIHAELSTKESLITELFYGQIRSTVRCLGCQQIESRNESISFLPLPISNYNQKNILYIKVDGEQCFISIQINSSVVCIEDLIRCFVEQYAPTLSRDRIQAVQLINNRVTKLCEIWNSLINIPDKELAFIERPEKLKNQKRIWCEFVEHYTDKFFRPPSMLVCPTQDCNYMHLSDQIDQLRGHLCSTTDAPATAFYLFWLDQYNKKHELNTKASPDVDLPYLQAITIEMSTKWVDIYKKHYDITYSADNSRLQNLIADFFREEPLDGDYHCLNCPKPTKARQKSDLYLPLPRVLIIQLKRFTYDIYSNDKIDTFISFPLDGLDLNEYLVKDDSKNHDISSSTKYDLVAISNHTGSLTSGHYITYAKNVQNGKWYSFDDKFIRKFDSDNDVITKNAYILVYVQKSNDQR